MPLDITEVRRRLDAGESPKDIATALGCSLRRVYQIRGVEQPREDLDPVMRTKIAEDLARGVSQRMLAEAHGLSRKTVAAIARDIGKPALPTPKVLPGETVAHILRRHKAGHSSGTIARELELSTSTVRAVIVRNGDGGLKAGDDIMRAIKDEMRERGMTAGDLAKVLPAPPTREQMYEYLRGDVAPSSVIASRIIAALGGRIVFARDR